MWKKVLVIIGLCLLGGYLIFAAVYFEKKPDDSLCNRFSLAFAQDSLYSMIDLVDIEKEIDAKGLNPYGKQLKEIDTYKIEETIVANPLIKSAEVFITNKATIQANIVPRKPVLRVITNNKDYYIDSDGKVMPLSKTKTIYLPIVTGRVSEEFAANQLYQFALFLENEPFWNAQIEQINVVESNNIELVPRVGDQKIIFGSLDNYKEKLENLMAFYQKGLSETGWNRYKEISLKYDKQVVGTKR